MSTFSVIKPPKGFESVVRLFFYPEIHSKKDNHRLELREQLIKHLDGLSDLDCQRLRDLNQIPEIPNKAISLSHCPLGSVILIQDSHESLGVDLEEAQRIKDPVVARISTFSERQHLIEGADLFTAKEAAWKALNKSFSIAAISQIEISQWESLDSGWKRYSVKLQDTPLPGCGFCRHHEGLQLSFYGTHSTFS